MKILIENSFFLKEMTSSQVTMDYVKWFEDPEIVRYSDNQYRSITFDSQVEYVKNCLKSPNILLAGIFDESLHIGNICINDIASVHKRAEITYVIGNKTYWGSGLATKSIKRVIQYLKDEYDLNKLYAGVSSLNIGSKRVLEKNEFILEGVRKKHLYYNNMWSDCLEYGLILSN